jgi:hypothetical protein
LKKKNLSAGLLKKSVAWTTRYVIEVHISNNRSNSNLKGAYRLSLLVKILILSNKQGKVKNKNEKKKHETSKTLGISRLLWRLSMQHTK